MYLSTHPAAMNTHRPALQAMYQQYFSANNLDAILFPTTILPAPTIDAMNGSAQSISINGAVVSGMSQFSAIIRNTDPGSNAVIPGLFIPAGLTAAGLPVGREIDGPLGSDQTLLVIGMSMEAVLGRISALDLTFVIDHQEELMTTLMRANESTSRPHADSPFYSEPKGDSDIVLAFKSIQAGFRNMATEFRDKQVATQFSQSCSDLVNLWFTIQ